MLLGFDAVGAAPVGAAPEDDSGSVKVKAAQQLPQADQTARASSRPGVSALQTLDPLVQSAASSTVLAESAAQATLQAAGTGRAAPLDQVSGTNQLDTLRQTGLVAPTPAVSGDTPTLGATNVARVAPRLSVNAAQSTTPPITSGDLDTTRHQLAAEQTLNTLVTVLQAVTVDAISAAQTTYQPPASADFRSGGVNVSATQTTTAPITSGQFGPRPGVSSAQSTLPALTTGQFGPRPGVSGDTPGMAVLTALAATSPEAISAAQTTYQAPASADFLTGVRVTATQLVGSTVTSGLFGPRPGVSAVQVTAPAVTAGALSTQPGVAASQSTRQDTAQTAQVFVVSNENAAQVTQQSAAQADIDTVSQAATAQTTTVPISSGLFGPRPGVSAAQQTSANTTTTAQFATGVAAAGSAVTLAAIGTGRLSAIEAVAAAHQLFQAGAIIRILTPLNMDADRITAIPLTTISGTAPAGVIYDQPLSPPTQLASTAAPDQVVATQTLAPIAQTGDPLPRWVSAAQSLSAPRNAGRIQDEAVARATQSMAAPITAGQVRPSVGMVAARTTLAVTQVGAAKTILASQSGQVLPQSVWIKIDYPALTIAATQDLSKVQTSGQFKSGIAFSLTQALTSSVVYGDAVVSVRGNSSQILAPSVNLGQLRTLRLRRSPAALFPF